MSKNYRITLLPGDGIGPEIMKVAVAVLQAIAPKFDLTFAFETALIGGVTGCCRWRKMGLPAITSSP